MQNHGHQGQAEPQLLHLNRGWVLAAGNVGQGRENVTWEAQFREWQRLDGESRDPMSHCCYKLLSYQGKTLGEAVSLWGTNTNIINRPSCLWGQNGMLGTCAVSELNFSSTKLEDNLYMVEQCF